MIRVDGIKIFAEEMLQSKLSNELLKTKLAKKLNIKPEKIKSFEIIKKSVDARKKPAYLLFSFAVDLANPEKYLKIKGVSAYQAPKITLPTVKKSGSRPLIVGFGPAGMFAAYLLALAGQRPIVYERGSEVDIRSKKVAEFWQMGKLDYQCNVQFGEGGAGSFSDGKLTTNINDSRCRFIMETLVKFGAPKEILYKTKAHIGTDILRKVVKNLRLEIIALGGEVHFDSLMRDLLIEKQHLVGLQINDSFVPCETAFLALGHSARDSFELLHHKGLSMEAKAFAVGVRIEHLQSAINQSQYGTDVFGAAEYKLAYHGKERSTYTFCMCPGGMVVAAASEQGRLVTNGMSYYRRNLTNANSALLVEVKASDFNSDDLLAGVEFQRHYEELAFKLGGGNYFAPVQTVGGFLADEVRELGRIKPSYQPGYRLSQISDCLPPFVTGELKQAIPYFAKKLKGFAAEDAVLTAIESRSSSPLRILRTADFNSSIQGIYPIGEGAGYAGGIVSAALDGIKSASYYLECL